MAGGINSYGPPIVDFSPLGKLFTTYQQAREQQQQLEMNPLRKQILGLQAQQMQQEIEAAKQAPELLKQIYGGGATDTAVAATPGALSQAATPTAANPRAVPTFSAIQGAAPSANIKGVIASAAEKYNVDPTYLTRTAQIESGFNPNAKNPNSSAGGLFQFIDSTAKGVGLANKFDPAQASDAAAQLTAVNRQGLRNALGREPTQGELYLAHQQGLGGATKLLRDPNARAADVVGADAVRLNGGDASMTAGQFAQKWTGKFADLDRGQGANTLVGGNDTLRNTPQSQPFDPNAPLPAYLQQAQARLAQLGPLQGNRDKTVAAAATAEVNRINSMINAYRTSQQTKADQLALEAAKDAKPVTVAPGGRIVDPKTGTVIFESPPEDKTSPDYKDYLKAREDPKYAEFLVAINKSKASNVNVGTGDGPDVDFNKEIAKGVAKDLNETVAAGREAVARLDDIRSLRESSRAVGDQGVKAPFKQMIGPWLKAAGIPVENLSEIEFNDALVKRIAPTLRVAGSGATDQKEYQGFLASLGTLQNDERAREMIYDTFERAARWDIARAEIADRARLRPGDEGYLTRGQAIQMTKALPSPFEAFKAYREANPDQVNAAIMARGKAPPPAPTEARGGAQAATPQRRQVRSAEDYASVGKNEEYVDPDGNVRRKR